MDPCFSRPYPPNHGSVGCYQEGPYCKIFNNADFGFWRITVERPLRLNFAATPERLERLKAAAAFAALIEGKNGRVRKVSGADGTARQGSFPGHGDDGDDGAPGENLQKVILKALGGLAAGGVVKNRDEFTGRLKKAFKTRGVTVPPPLFKTVLAALSERDETADICTDARGNPEPDADLRDNENVPLKEDIQGYFRREVLPHVPDAWIDDSKTRKGYEIPFTRHFYEYKPLRPLSEIEAEILTLEAEIQGMLKGVMP